MGETNGKLRLMNPTHVAFFCPGCQRPHVLRVGGNERPRWGYNGDPKAPTFTPSVHHNAPGAQHVDGLPTCHSFVTNGQIRYLPDSTHHLAGQTVELPPYPSM